jgi:hypothetical protein
LKFENIKFDNFKSLDEFYSFLDENALNLYIEVDIYSYILKYKNITKSKDELLKLQWELEISLFEFYGNQLFSFSYSVEENLKEFTKYPNLDQFQINAFNYLKSRSESSNSNFLKAKYFHILWKEKTTKNRSYAKKSITFYFKTINQLLNLEKDKQSVIEKLFEKLISIANESKLLIPESKQLALKLILNSNIDFHIKHNIINKMLKYPKIFKPIDFPKVLDLFKHLIKSKKNKIDDFSLVYYYLPTAIKIAQKTNKSNKLWHDEIGFANLRLAKEENDKYKNWIKLGYYESAINSFRLSGNIKHKKYTEQLYFELKPHIKLDTHRIDFDDITIQKLKEFDTELKEKAISFLNNPPNLIYNKIANGVFFPKYDYILNSLDKNLEPSFLKGVSAFHFDNNKNISKKNDNDENEIILKTYGDRIDGTLLPFLHYVLILGLKSGHLTYQNMLKFFLKHTWIGNTNKKTDLGGNIIESNWINQIAPSIIEFCIQVIAWGESDYYRPNFILCIDSLTLKIEGLFRNFCERINITTSIGKQNGVKEVLLHDVIDNEKIRTYFNKDDMLLFDYVLSNNDGALNIRNNIAHCFYHEKEYHLNKMLLLLAVLFRLGKYNIKENPLIHR